MAYIFLSHSHSDKPFAKRLAADLRNAGHSVWVDEAEINIGDSLIAKIRDGLDQVDFVCAILSIASVTSQWVSKELEIASNREIEEKKIIVLPLLVEDVALPGFLKGKFYGDFRTEDQYEAQFNLLLRSLGPSTMVEATSKDELEQTKAALERALKVAQSFQSAERRASDAAFRSKSDELKIAIDKANNAYPQHAPINRTYAFQIGSIFITLDYALWSIAKSEYRGSHPLEALLTIEDRWGDLENMLEAYGEMLDHQTGATK